MFGVGFAAVSSVYARTGRVQYVTATNLAFRRDDFPGYDLNLTQGGDEIDVLPSASPVWPGDLGPRQCRHDLIQANR